MANTAYDDVFRTLLNDCSSLVLPVLNEMFGEHYTGKEKIIFFQNEHFLNQQDGVEEKRITDTCFVVEDDKTKRYHLECESSNDSSILIRIFEYDAQIALDHGELKDYVLTVTFPHSALLALRATKNTPDKMKVRIITPEDSIEYDIMVMKIKSFRLNEIFTKKLYFIIPFYIFTHESNFDKYAQNEEKLEQLKKEYELIINELEQACENHELDEFTKCTIVDMANKVLEHITSKYQNIGKGVKEVMGGQILEHEAKTIRNEGERIGEIKGEIKGDLKAEGRYARLTQMLLREKRLDDLYEASMDVEHRNKLYKEFNIE